ncbi:DNA uptake protein [Hydrococcus rivularis NIES-593]|uniref:DNA uptake protein n=1 Tax=Hydrococcus rivularis NIES-593 TaxID=1921803 RepID=A0A1U7HA02_9CYAN|nr:ComEA family DNA-binding protein [Hydrococcus rivularis]OKH20422.1 DNA uptake protein [Hydrococcus rivularis NIES-593]
MKWLNPNWQKIRAKILSDPYYRFQSLEEVAIAIELGIQIDANHASVDDWLRLPGISIHQARTLVELTGMGVQFLCIEDIAAAINVPVQRLQPLKPILFFGYSDTESLLTPRRINPNTASTEQLEQIPGLKPSLAELIVQNRQENGVYRNLADLQRRLVLDGRLISQLMHYFQF